MTKEEILKAIQETETTTARNRMGCSENWYNTYWAMRQTFTLEELEAMSEEELNNLIKLGDAISEGLW